jgi:hypothetical protein
LFSVWLRHWIAAAVAIKSRFAHASRRCTLAPLETHLLFRQQLRHGWHLSLCERYGHPRGSEPKPLCRTVSRPILHEIQHSQPLTQPAKRPIACARALRPDRALTIAVIAATLLTVAGIAPLLLMTEVVRITHALVVCALGLP